MLINFFLTIICHLDVTIFKDSTMLFKWDGAAEGSGWMADGGWRGLSRSGNEWRQTDKPGARGARYNKSALGVHRHRQQAQCRGTSGVGGGGGVGRIL